MVVDEQQQQQQQLNHGLGHGDEDSFLPLFSDEPLRAAPDLDQFLPPVSRVELNHQAAQLRQARIREPSGPLVCRPVAFLFPAAACAARLIRVVLFACRACNGRPAAHRAIAPSWMQLVIDATRQRKTIVTRMT